MALDPKVQAAFNTLYAAIVAPGPGVAIPAPTEDPVAVPAGPGVAPGTVTPVWWRNPGVALVDPVLTCFDNETEAKRYAAQGFNASGVKCFGSQGDFDKALKLADALSVAKTAQEAENLLSGAGSLDSDAAIYALLTGWTQGASFGTPVLYCGPKTLAELITKPGTIIGGNIF